MYIFDFDPENNGIELSWRDTGSEIPRREARPVYVYHIITEGTLDPVVLLRLQTKRKAQDMLFEYLKDDKSC